VISEVKNSPFNEFTPSTRNTLVEQARGTLNTGWEGAERAVSALQRAAAMLPNAITARATAAVPNVTITPTVQVQVNTPAASPSDSKSSSTLDEAMRSQAVLAGSQTAAKGSGS
jgi:hypothetical protein